MNEWLGDPKVYDRRAPGNEDLETAEAAALLGVSRKVVVTLAEAGLIPSTVWSGGRRHFRRGELEALILTGRWPLNRRNRTC